jgi:hypothetical protein
MSSPLNDTKWLYLKSSILQEGVADKKLSYGKVCPALGIKICETIMSKYYIIKGELYAFELLS